MVYDEFFKNEIVYKVYSDRIEFRKPTLTDRKNILNPNKTKTGTGYSFTISGDLDLNTGSYNFEEIEDNDSWVYKKAVKRGGRTRSVKCLLAH